MGTLCTGIPLVSLVAGTSSYSAGGAMALAARPLIRGILNTSVPTLGAARGPSPVFFPTLKHSVSVPRSHVESHNALLSLSTSRHLLFFLCSYYHPHPLTAVFFVSGTSDTSSYGQYWEQVHLLVAAVAASFKDGAVASHSHHRIHTFHQTRESAESTEPTSRCCSSERARFLSTISFPCCGTNHLD